MTAPVVRRARDLTTWRDGDHVYVVACDANASVGELPNDFMRRPPEEAGYNAAKVALMETLAAGATPLVVADALCGPLDDYGVRVVDGIRRALAEIGSDAVLTGSDETNMTTTQTGVGITVIGRVSTDEFRLGTSRSGDLVLCIGMPKDGVIVPYREGDDDIAGPRHVLAVLATAAHEILPVGSRGVGYEVRQLGLTAGLDVELDPDCGIDLVRSAGASTCFLVSAPPLAFDSIRAVVDLPVAVVATLRERRPVHQTTNPKTKEDG